MFNYGIVIAIYYRQVWEGKEIVFDNEYIDSLIKANKIKNTVDKNINFGFKIGSKILGKDKVLIAGPCSVESKEMIEKISIDLKEIGVDALRGGAYKPCTYPVRDTTNGWKEGLKKKVWNIYLMQKI